MKNAKKDTTTTVILTKGTNGRSHKMTKEAYDKADKTILKRQGWVLAEPESVFKKTDNPDEFIVK